MQWRYLTNRPLVKVLQHRAFPLIQKNNCFVLLSYAISIALSGLGDKLIFVQLKLMNIQILLGCVTRYKLLEKLINLSTWMVTPYRPKTVSSHLFSIQSGQIINWYKCFRPLPSQFVFFILCLLTMKTRCTFMQAVFEHFIC